jgi:hypothetical protein
MFAATVRRVCYADVLAGVLFERVLLSILGERTFPESLLCRISQMCDFVLCRAAEVLCLCLLP